jgi:hypothetical protein
MVLKYKTRGLHQISLVDPRESSDEFEKRLSDTVQYQPELAGNVSKLAEDYDNDMLNSEMGYLKGMNHKNKLEIVQVVVKGQN